MGRKGNMTHVVCVSSINKRDILIANIRTNLEVNKDKNIEVVQDRQNRIKIYHLVPPDIKVCIKTILVVVIQVHINLEPLKEIYDDTVFYDLEEVFSALEHWKKKLYNMKNVAVQKRRDNSAKYTRLVESLSDIAG